jgi:hypothetical protein
VPAAKELVGASEDMSEDRGPDMDELGHQPLCVCHLTCVLHQMPALLARLDTVGIVDLMSVAFFATLAGTGNMCYDMSRGICPISWILP